jgi:hypothetical protein
VFGKPARGAVIQRAGIPVSIVGALMLICAWSQLAR